MEYRETAKLTETQHLQPSSSTLTKEVSVESEKGFLLLTFINVRSTQLICIAYLLKVLPLNSSHSVLNVYTVGNCCFPLPLNSHHLKRMSPSVLLFIFKGLTWDMHPKVGFNGLTASKVPCKSVELTWICSSCLKEQEECGCVWERPVGGTHSGLAQTGAYSRDHSASVSSSLLQRQGGEFLWNHAITLNLTTLSKHNWTKLDRWERDRRKRWSFTADTI